VLDLSLEKRPQFYFIQSYYSDHPMVHLSIMESAAKPVVWNNVSLGFDSMTENWNRASGSKVNVIAYSNAEEVELFLNGNSLGTQQNKMDDINNRNKFAWFVDYMPGDLKAVARTHGQVVAEHQLETVGEPVAIKLEPENANWKADGLDLQHIRVHVVDNNGRKLLIAKNLVRFDLEGPAKLIALDNGDIKSDEEFVAKERSLNEGHALAILRAGKEPGTVVLKASADGLQQAKLSMQLQ
jgi:beta-galactosidase